jgi:hypothetical protein
VSCQRDAPKSSFALAAHMLVGEQTRSLKNLEGISRCHRHRLNAACIRGRTGRDSMTRSFGRIMKAAIAVTAAWVIGVARFDPIGRGIRRG